MHDGSDEMHLYVCVCVCVCAGAGNQIGPAGAADLGRGLADLGSLSRLTLDLSRA